MDQDISSHRQRKWAESKSFILFKQIEAESSRPQCGSELSNEQRPAFLFRTIHNYWDFPAHLNRINKAGKFKTNQACWIMQQGVLCAWHDQLFSTGKKTGQFFHSPWFIWLYKNGGQRRSGHGQLLYGSHISKALMVPYGDRDKTRARMRMQH